MKKTLQKIKLTPQQQSLLSRLNNVMLIDYRRLAARIKGLSAIKNQQSQHTVGMEIEQDIQQAEYRLQQRKSAVKNPIVFPESLPVSQRKAEIQTLIAEHQVVIVAGETRIR